MANNTNTNKFMYGLHKFEFDGKLLGYISKDSFDWGGAKGEALKVNAEQVPGQPVLILQQSNSTIAPSFDLIQIDADNIAAALGGTVEDGKWHAPTELVQNIAPAKITTFSGHIIEMPKVMLNSNLEGGLKLSEVSHIKVELEVMQPDDGSSPYTIDGIAASPQAGDQSGNQGGGE